MLVKHNGKFYRDNAEITEEKYNEIMAILKNRPSAPVGYSHRLTEDLQWELYELPKEETDEPIESDMTEIEEKAKAYDIIMGVSE